MGNGNYSAVQQFVSVKIEITNINLECTCIYKVGQIVSGQREILCGIRKKCVWVKSGLENNDWIVFFIGDTCRLIV